MTDDRDDVEFGPARPRRRWPRWLPLAAAALAVALVVAWIVPKGTPPSSSAPATTSSPVPSSTASRSSSLPTSPRPKVVDLHRRLLSVTGRWELFAFARTTVVRIQLARGRVTYTKTPVLQSSGPVFFVVGPHRAVVRPLDFVPGYVVPDGHHARKLIGPLAYGGPVIPGPEQNQVWVTSKRHQHRMVLVGLDGHRTGISVQASLGDESTAGATSDGGGYLLVTGTGGAYQARPDGWHRITTGSVVAVGPTGWLAVECDKRHRCSNVVIDRASGARRVLRGSTAETNMPPTGVISPDGSTAAVYDRTSAGKASLHLIDLRTGADHVVLQPGHGYSDFYNGTLAWSPDSRWLFAVDSFQVTSRDNVFAINPRTRHVRPLGVALPPISQLAVRRSHR